MNLPRIIRADLGANVIQFGGFTLYRDRLCTSQDGVRLCGPDHGWVLASPWCVCRWGGE